MSKLIIFLVLAPLLIATSIVEPRWGAPIYVEPGGVFNITLAAPVVVKNVALTAPGFDKVELDYVVHGVVITVRIPPDINYGLYDIVINNGEVYEPKAVWVAKVTGPLRILHITDGHVGVELDMSSIYRIIHAILVANSRPYDVVFATGDFADVGGQFWHVAMFVRYASMLTKPIFVIPGNHEEAGDEKLMNYRALVGPPVWHRVVGPYLIIGLNSGFNGFLTDEQVRYYEEILERYRDKVKIVLIHHPPFYIQNRYVEEIYRGPQDVERLARDPEGRRPYYLVYTSYLQNRGAYEKFIDLTIRHRVSLVLSGHVHSGNSTVVINSTYFVTTRTLGGSIDTSHGFREVVVYPDGRVEVGQEVLTYKNFAVVTWGSRGAQIYAESTQIGDVLTIDLPGLYRGFLVHNGSAQLLEVKTHPLDKYHRYVIKVSKTPFWFTVGEFSPAPVITVERIIPRSPELGDIVTIIARAEDLNIGVPFIYIDGKRVLASYVEERPVYFYRFKYDGPRTIELIAPGGRPQLIEIRGPATPQPTPPTTPATTPATPTQTITPTPTQTPTTTPIIETPTAATGIPLEVLVLLTIAAVGTVVVALARRR